jgi:hypothetical protein
MKSEKSTSLCVIRSRSGECFSRAAYLSLSSCLLHAVCAPFPVELLTNEDGERDYPALRRCLEELPPPAVLANIGPSAAAGLTAVQHRCLIWLLSRHRTPAPSISTVPLEHFASLGLASLSRWMATNASLRPAVALRLGAPPPNDAELCFHGTSFENLWSILQAGLLNLSGTRLERTGAVHGTGIYLSKDPGVAFSFSAPAEAWHGSAIGRKLRCLLVCGVSDHGLGRKTDGSSSGGGGLPEKYIVIERSDLVKVHYVLLYADAPPVSTSHRGSGSHQARCDNDGHAAGLAMGRWHVSSVVFILLAYATYYLLLMPLRDPSSPLQQFLRRRFGIRLQT